MARYNCVFDNWGSQSNGVGYAGSAPYTLAGYNSWRWHEIYKWWQPLSDPSANGGKASIRPKLSQLFRQHHPDKTIGFIPVAVPGIGILSPVDNRWGDSTDDVYVNAAIQVSAAGGSTATLIQGLEHDITQGETEEDIIAALQTGIAAWRNTLGRPNHKFYIVKPWYTTYSEAANNEIRNAIDAVAALDENVFVVGDSYGKELADEVHLNNNGQDALAIEVDSNIVLLGGYPLEGEDELSIIPDIYIDKDAAGANTGLNWADAYTDPNSASPVAGDIVGIREGTYELKWSLNGNGGDENPIRVYVFDGDNNVYGAGDGVKAIFDAGGVRDSGINCLAYEGYEWHNIGCVSSTGNGWESSGTAVDWHYWFDCGASDNIGNGFGNNFRQCRLVRSYSKRNTVGFETNVSCQVVDCLFEDNISYDYECHTAGNAFGCVFKGSPIAIKIITGTNIAVLSCTFIGCSDKAILNTGTTGIVRNCLFHSCNQNYADEAVSDGVFWSSNFTYSTSAADTINGYQYVDIADTELLVDPFVNKNGGNYEIVAGSNAKSVEIVYDENNSSFIDIGALQSFPIATAAVVGSMDISATVDGDSVRIVNIDVNGNNVYVVYIDSNENLMVKNKNFIANESYQLATSASM